jgi:hypothetical protein
MSRSQPAPLSERLVTVSKGAAQPAPQPGQRAPAAEPARVPITFRLTPAAHEWLRAEAYRSRRTKQAIVDAMFADYMARTNNG